MERPEKRNDEGFAQVGIGQTAATILGTVFWLIVALMLHPVAYGHLAWLVSIATLVSALCGLGLGTMIATYYPREENKRLLSTSVFLTLLASGVGGIVTAVVLNLSVDSSLATLVGLLVVALSMFSMAFYSELGKREYKKYMWMWIGVRAATLILPLTFYLLWGTVAGLLGGMIAGYFLFGTLVLKHLGNGLKFADVRRKTGFSARAWASNMAIASLNFLDKILIGVLFPLGFLAIYQFSFRIFLLLAILPNTLFFYLLPERSGGGDVKKLERAGILLSVALAVAIFFLAPYITSHVFPGYREGIDTIRIMGLAIIPATIARIRSSRLFSEEKPAVVLGSNLFGLAIGITCIIMTFTQGLGLIGLAVSMLASQVGLLGGLFLIPKLLRFGFPGRIGLSFIVVIVASALIMSTLGIISPQITVRKDRVIGTGGAMDTRVTITVLADDEEDVRQAKEAISAAFREIDRVEKLMSATDPDSEIYRLNNSGTQWVELSPEVIYILKKSQEYSVLTDGCFDVTVKPLVDFWMKEVKRSGKMPTGDELSQYLELVDYRNLIIDEDNNRARFNRDGMEVTLGGIAKGYAVDRACEVLKGGGIEEALVDIGGDIRAIGTKSWRIGIRDPRAEEVLVDIELENKAIATSGDYVRYHLLKGAELVHHIINPKTGAPARDSISVTIVAQDSLTADALSTGVFVIGPEKGRVLLDLIRVGGLIVGPEGEIITSEYWGYDIAR
ncbi:MAG: FAD:protein FMN transferase [Dehalococcoidia bacterium]